MEARVGEAVAEREQRPDAALVVPAVAHQHALRVDRAAAHAGELQPSCAPARRSSARG